MQLVTNEANVKIVPIGVKKPLFIVLINIATNIII